MRVKQLEVVGFKSFATKTTIHFEPGVTAIVGPNGSGKSNLVDAIRWVLGEHNPRDVRAPRLEDVIFNGTDRKAPISMAEVSLTIDNAQGLLPISFTEVTITRRVFRSGESECFINQSPCRLRDIHELFLGTGLGGGTYAIIEQGHIDLILSSKPEERRVVFEEASGVAKYLAKKHETMRKLDEVEEHLLRIADIIGEVRRQVSALERAANKARQYKAQWEQLQQLELRLAVDELCGGATRDRELEAAMQQLIAQHDGLEAQKQHQMEALEACNASVSAIQQHLQDLHAKVAACTSQIEQHESQSALKRRWIEERVQQSQTLEQEAGQLRERISQCEEQLARAAGGQTELQSQLTTIAEQFSASARELAVLESAMQEGLGAVERAKAHLFEAASDASHRRNELAELTTRLQSVEAQLSRLDDQLTQAAARDEDVRQRQQAALQEREQLRTQQAEIHRRSETVQQHLEAAATRRHELSGRLHQLRDQVASHRAQVALREDLWRRYEGFPDTVKTLMSRGVDGLLGPLVDLMEAAPGYETVVEAALGPLAEALVVRDRAALARCREVLTSQQLESCRFLVLADCPRSPAMESTVAQEGVSGAVKQYVRAQPQYQPLVDWILNDSWIIDDIQRLLGNGLIPQGRLVSPRGDRWDRRSWRFGAARAAHSPACAARGGDCECGAAGRRLGRRQRWEEAQAALQTLEQGFQRLDETTKAAEQEWQGLLGEQESAKGQIAQLTPGLQKLEHQLSQLNHEVKRIEEEQLARRLEVEELASQREELRAALVLAQRVVGESQVRQRSLERSLTEAQAARESSEQRRQQLTISQAQRAATRQSLAERLQTIQARVQELEADRARLSRELEAKGRQRTEALTRSQELTQQLAEHEQGRAQQTEARRQLDAEVARVRETLHAEEAKRDQVLPQVMAVEQQLSTLAQQIQQHTQQRSERQFRRSHLLERLRELYRIEEAAIQAEIHAHPAPLTEEQRGAMSADVQKLRGKLEGIGPVSLGSVEEYDALKSRHEFLQRQQQDLIRGRDDLKASITQINRTARAQFRETFERIKQEFKHYYGRLFDGGEADLILMDQEDVLESGIDIVARPPGKRLQSISLLSGGERALTAVALLFALFKVRPSPFCILDEIDAPLDEANVDRFTRVLEEFLALSQFILITHNKKTITKADSLYGVTMEEAGVSKILSAKLTSGERPQPAAAALADI